MNTDSIKDMQKVVADFCTKHRWDKWHTPKNAAIIIACEVGEKNAAIIIACEVGEKNAAIIIACEVGELLQIFRFAAEDQQKDLLQTPESREMIENELADVFYGVLDFANRTDIDLGKALLNKINLNLKKYPIKAGC